MLVLASVCLPTLSSLLLLLLLLATASSCSHCGR
jgi:hypothetical protein